MSTSLCEGKCGRCRCVIQVQVHGWVCELGTGLIKDLHIENIKVFRLHIFKLETQKFGNLEFKNLSNCRVIIVPLRNIYLHELNLK